MVSQGILLCFTVFHVCSLVFYRFSLVSQGSRQFSQAFVSFLWSSVVSPVSVAFLWFLSFPQFSLVFIGCPWFSLGMQSFCWFSIVVTYCLHLYMFFFSYPRFSMAFQMFSTVFFAFHTFSCVYCGSLKFCIVL